jgi:hypothetical protein
MAQAAQDYYRNLAKFTDIVSCNQSEDTEITRVDDKQVEVEIKNIAGKRGSFYHRVFERNETKKYAFIFWLAMIKYDNRPAEKSILLRISGAPATMLL